MELGHASKPPVAARLEDSAAPGVVELDQFRRERPRHARAAEALHNSDATLNAIARQVGYANAFALTVAFKRIRGTTPQLYRAGRP